VTTPTLDRARRDRLHTFLVEEARRSPAEMPTTRHTAARRTILAAGAAVVVAGGVLALGTTGRGGPAPEPAGAVSIVEEDGWVRISLRDPEASAASIVAEIEAAGIAGRAEVLPECPPEGSSETYPPLCMRGMTPGLALLAPEPGPSVPPMDPRDPGGFDEHWEAMGMRSNDDGSVSVRPGHDVVIVVYEVV
jgi:hypothetical protein